MVLRLYRWAIATIAALLIGQPLCAHKPVSKEFLVHIDQQLRNNPLTSDSMAALSAEANNTAEQSFVEALQSIDVSDIYAPTRPESDEDFAYNILNWRGIAHIREDHAYGNHSDCRKVTVYDDGSLHESSLFFKNKPPRSSKHIKKSWYFSYCVGEDRNSDKSTLLYYFHGASGSPVNWTNRKALAEVRSQWRKKGPLPRWVSVSLGRFGSLLDVDAEKKFFRTVVNHVEEKLGIHRSDYITRFGLGVSMGGANVAQTVLLDPGFFNAAVLVCPAVASINMSIATERAALMLRSKAWASVLMIASHLLPEHLRRPEYYASVDPMLLAQSHFSAKTPPLFIQTSSKDQFGLNEGGRIFALLARTRGVSVQFEELKGGHCTLRPKAIAEFFTNFEAQSRADYAAKSEL